MRFAPVTPGKQSGHRLCFARQRVIRYEIVDGISVALVSMHAAPDHVVSRGQVVTPDELAALWQQYVVCRNGLQPYVAPDGGTYLAVPVAAVRGQP